jgi:hypothetical protein
MPSAKEELGSVFDSAKNLENTDFFSNLHRAREHRLDNSNNNNNINNKNEDDVLNNEDIIELEKIAEVDPEGEGLDEEEEAYSDFTEKLQSFYPECKSNPYEKWSFINDFTKLLIFCHPLHSFVLFHTSPVKV